MTPKRTLWHNATQRMGRSKLDYAIVRPSSRLASIRVFTVIDIDALANFRLVFFGATCGKKFGNDLGSVIRRKMCLVRQLKLEALKRVRRMLTGKQGAQNTQPITDYDM